MLRAIACAALLLALSSLPAAAGPVTLLSRADPERPSDTAGGWSEVAGISSDGRYVLLRTNADNLLDGVSDANVGLDLFLHDRIAGTTVLVSHAAGDPTATADGGVEIAALSADGRWVAFVSDAANLVAGQVDQPSTSFNAPDLFLWDRDTGLIQLVSHEASLPTTAAGGCNVSSRPGISADGSRIAFLTQADNLVAGQTSDFSSNAFLYDRTTATNTLISHVSGVPTAATGAGDLALSADGSWVAFSSNAADIVSGQIDSNDDTDVFLYDVAAGSSILVSHASSSASTAANNGSFSPQISTDGSRIAYGSAATNLVAGQVDDNFDYDVFLYDRTADTSTLVSHISSSAVTAGDQYSENISLSADGRYVAYGSGASDLVTNDASPWQDVFFYDHVTGTNLLLSRGDAPGLLSGDSFEPGISSDGAWVAFWSQVPDLMSGQTDELGSPDAFLWSRATETITLVTRTPGSATTAAGDDELFRAGQMMLGADGSWVALSSLSEELVDGIDDHNGLSDAFLYERATGVHRLLTPRGGAVSASAGGQIPDVRTVMSNDGRYIVFTSEASNLPGISDGNSDPDIFLHDRIAGTTKLVSHASSSLSTTANGGSYTPRMSADGSVVVFEGFASDLVPGAGPGGQLYLYERTTDQITLVDHAPSSPSTGAEGFLEDGYVVSSDGRWVAFAHSGSLIDGQMEGNSGADLFLFDRSTGTNTLISHASSSLVQTANGTSRNPSISADGRHLAFVSTASDLVSGQVGAGGIFLHDRIAGTTIRVSASGESFSISADGRWIVFASNATNVVPGQVDTNSASDVFLWDRVSEATLLVSRTPTSPTTTGNARSDLESFVVDPPALSADGRWVVFSSNATNLISGQTGSARGVFLFDRIAGTVTLVSRSAASPTDVRSASVPAISADGRFVAFASFQDDLVPGQVDGGFSSNFFLYDRIASTTALVSHIPSSDVTSGTLDGNGSTFAPRISADGTWVAFHSPMPDLVADDHDGTNDVFLHANPLPGLDLYTVPPCRIVDTRQAGQGPVLTSGVKRLLMVHGVCGIPATARAVAVNVTVAGPTSVGNLSFYAGDLAPGGTSTINFTAGQTRASNAILSLAFDGTGTLAVTPFVAGGGTVDLIVDVSGYFE